MTPHSDPMLLISNILSCFLKANDQRKRTPLRTTVSVRLVTWSKRVLSPALILLCCVTIPLHAEQIELSESLSVIKVGDHNIVQATSRDGSVMQLLCDFRRDALGIVTPPQIYCIGNKELPLITNPLGTYWDEFVEQGRFYETNPVSMVPTEPWASQEPIENRNDNSPRAIGVRERDVLATPSHEIYVLDTPGVTRGSVSYYADIQGKRIVFCGNLIYGDGRLTNLYDLQDTFEGVNIDGYHGYMARAVPLIESLEKIRDLKPDLLVPARGPWIERPTEAIDCLITKLREVYKNYLFANALWWYFGDETMTQSARKVLGQANLDAAEISRLQRSKTYDLPPWILEFSTTRILVSRTGAALVVDCNGPNEFQNILTLIEKEKFKTVEAGFITHYHHDHVPGMALVAERFDCPIHCSEVSRPILEHPESFRMPCVAPVSIKNIDTRKTWTWHEFTLTAMHFPGQAIYHDALLVAKNDEDRPILFVGDSFTPTGIDDYCLWNRNFPGDDEGYLHCLDIYRNMTPRPYLINQHVEPMFDFEDDRIDQMVSALKNRRELLDDLFPYEGAGFGVDPVWARFEPYCLDSENENPIDLRLVIHNHAKRPLTFGLQGSDEVKRTTIPPGEEAVLSFPLTETKKKIQTNGRDYRIMTRKIHCEEDPTLEMSVEAILKN